MHFAFAALLILALLSDIADGWIAKKYSVESPTGALLDSVADILLMSVILYAIWPLHPYVYEDHGLVFIVVVVLWIFGHTAALIRYGRPASFHTRLIRVGIAAFSLFAVVLFTYGFVPWMLYLAAIICSLGVVEHFAMLVLLPEWTPDIHGGLPEVLRRRREGR
jgi:CDP-diacylglycerol--glycerol-3-phosphate 3-phosphatidyltransferase